VQSSDKASSLLSFNWGLYFASFYDGSNIPSITYIKSVIPTKIVTSLLWCLALRCVNKCLVTECVVTKKHVNCRQMTSDLLSYVELPPPPPHPTLSSVFGVTINGYNLRHVSLSGIRSTIVRLLGQWTAHLDKSISLCLGLLWPVVSIAIDLNTGCHQLYV